LLCAIVHEAWLFFNAHPPKFLIKAPAFPARACLSGRGGKGHQFKQTNARAPHAGRARKITVVLYPTLTRGARRRGRGACRLHGKLDSARSAAAASWPRHQGDQAVRLRWMSSLIRATGLEQRRYSALMLASLASFA